MSLKVWLPLNGDLRNNGLDDVTVTNNGATVNNNGKIGKCYSFSNNAIYGEVPNVNNMTEMSGCCWIYLTSLNSAQYFFHLGGINSYPSKISLDYEGSIRSQVNGKEYISGISLTVNTWYHIAVTVGNGKVKWYLNGEEKASANVSGNFNASNHLAIGARINSSAGNTFAYPIVNAGRLNDIRIYDHALSLKEVKEIAKGLVVHYPLDDMYVEYTANLITGLTAGKQTIRDGTSIRTKGEANADTYFFIKTLALTGGATYSLSCYVDGLDDGKNWSFGIGAQVGDNKCCSFVLYNGYNSCTFTLPSGLDNATQLIWDDNGFTVSRETTVMTISDIQLELKNHPTGFTPFNTTRDTATLYDYSGLENNSTAENLIVKDSNNIPNILSSTAVTIKNWTNINPDCMVLSIRESNPNKNRVFVKQAVSGKWENVYSPAITVTANQEYTLSCYYRVYDPYTFTSSYGNFGLTVMTSAPSNANPINNTIARIPFPNTITGSTKGSVTFTPTVDTIYLNICGGSIIDGQLGKTFDIDYIQLEEGDTTTEYVEPVRHNKFTVFNGSNSHILGESISSEALTASCWIYPKNTSSQICFIDYKSGLSFGMWNNQYIICSCKSNLNQAYPLTNLILNRWNHIVVQKNLTDSKMDLYINGVKQKVLRTDYWSSNMTDKLTIGARMNGTNPFNGYMSDFRIYASALTQSQILELYRNTTSVDKDNNFYSYEYDEMYQGNEIEYLHDLTKSNSGTFLQDKDGLHLDQNVWVTHTYIPIDPTGKTYKYDILYSNDAGNQFYIGWERYDIDKTSRSNNACVYVLASSTERNYYRIRGTVNLSTDGVNSCAFIKLRILNKWTGSNSNTQGKATIHSLSLKEYSNDNVLTPLNHTKQGIVNTTEIIESDIGVSINDTYELKSNNFYEI